MIPELGQFALIVALLLAITAGVLPLVGAARGITAGREARGRLRVPNADSSRWRSLAWRFRS
jgi:cytochrome c biogenesis factor